MSAILVIDDHPVNLQLMRGQLALLGHACDIASNPEEGLALWRAGAYRLVITDCHMRGLNGQELARRIRAGEAERGIVDGVPIIAWTADALSENLQQCRAAGMNGHLIKPTLLDPLRAIVDTWLLRKPPQVTVAPVAAPPAPPPPPLDARALADFSGGDPHLEKEIFGQFLETNFADFGQLHQALRERDMARVRALAHRIKGACRLIGAGPLGDVLERIEQAAHQDDWPAIHQQVTRMEAEQLRLVRFMEERFAEP